MALLHKQELKKISKLYLLSALALIVIFFAGVYTGNLLFPKKEIEVALEDPGLTITAVPTNPEKKYEPEVLGVFTAPSANYKDEDRILYISSEEVWYIKPDKTQRNKLTNDGVTESIRYLDADWQHPGIASYIKCAQICYVVTQDIASSTENVLHKLPDTIISVEDMQWSPNGTTLVLIVFNQDETREILQITEKDQKSLYKFPSVLARGTELTDRLNIEFNQSGNNFLINNSFNYPENQAEPTVLVFNKDGSILNKFFSTEKLITSASFYNDSKLVYRSGKQFVSSNLDGSAEAVLTELDEAYDLSAQDNKVAFWSFKVSGDPVLVLMDETNFVRHISIQYGDPQWTNSQTNLVAIEKQLSPLNDTFLDARLALVNIESGQASILVDEHILDFSIE